MLTESHRFFRKQVREFALKEVAPRAAETDRTGDFPWDTIRKMGQLGYFGIPFPEDVGGQGLDTLSYAIAVEEISRVCASTGIVFAAHVSLAAYPVFAFGSEKQRKKYLGRLLSGEMLGALGLTEPEAGSDAGATRTTAVLEAGHYVLNGTKHFITSGEIAGICIATAVTDKSKGTHGISNFIVEKGTPGFTCGAKERKMGLHGAITSELNFSDCRVPKENLLGAEGEGFRQSLTTLDGGRISIGAMALGIAQGALDEALAYAKQRVQFGRPVIKFQAIQWILADMATEIEAARRLVYHAAELEDADRPFAKEAAMAKLYASKIAMKATTDAIQVLGGYGYMKDYPVERMFRDAKLTEIGEGTSEIQRIVIARALMKEVS
jgi:butyryl-CoA dehydrogenase